MAGPSWVKKIGGVRSGNGQAGNRAPGELGKGRGGEKYRPLVPNADKI
jgi:hypothetical protein